MKIPPFSVALPSLAAVSLLFLGLFQACVTTPNLHPNAGDPQGGTNPLIWSSHKPVFVQGAQDSDRLRKVSKAMKLGKPKPPPNIDFCHIGQNGRRACPKVPNPHTRSGRKALAALVRSMKTEETSEKTSDDAPTPTPTPSPDALHVVQQVEFANEDAKKEFITALGYEPRS
jgi:hypothetical protein